MAKITENIKSLAEIITTLSNLEDQEFITEQWLSEQDILDIRSELNKEMDKYKQDVQSYVEYKLNERMEHQILSSWISEKIKILNERKSSEDKKIEKIDWWIDYLCKFAWITWLKTPAWEIKYTWSDKMKIQDIDILPENLKELIIPIKFEFSQKKSLEEFWIQVEVKSKWLNEVKKRYKTLSDEERKQFEWKIWIDDSKSISIKQ